MKNVFVKYIVSFLPLLHFATFLLHSTVATIEPATQGPSSSINASNTEFIRANCQTTLYPELCFKSLSNYATKINQDSSELACVAIGVSLSKVKHMGNYVSKLTPQASYKDALQDCVEMFDDAVYRTRDSLKQMRQLNGTGQSLRFQLDNVRTWMSAALTCEDTCTESFGEAPDGSMKDDVVNRVSKIMKVTSNALSLVNSYFDKVTTP